MSYEVKQVIAVRRDLKMRRGKEAAQVAHAAMGWLIDLLSDLGNPGHLDRDVSHDLAGYLDTYETRWLFGDHAKIVVQVADEAELLALEKTATEAGLTTHVVTDLGRTEFGGVPTRTCVAIGPNLEDQVNAVCGHLKLY